MGDVQLRLPAVGRAHGPPDPRGHRRAELPASRAARLLSQGLLHPDAAVLAARADQTAQVLGAHLPAARSEARAGPGGPGQRRDRPARLQAGRRHDRPRQGQQQHPVEGRAEQREDGLLQSGPHDSLPGQQFAEQQARRVRPGRRQEYLLVAGDFIE